MSFTPPRLGLSPALYPSILLDQWNRQYFDVPGAIALGDGVSRTRRDMTNLTGAGGGNSVGGGFRSSDKPAGKRMRIRVSSDPKNCIAAVVVVAVVDFCRMFAVRKMLLSCRLLVPWTV